MRRLGPPVGLATLAVALVLLGAPGAQAASPYFGTDYDCSPIMTDTQALAVTGTTRNVVESAQVFPFKGYSCSWSLASKFDRATSGSRAITLAVSVNWLKSRPARLDLTESLCDESPLPLTKAQKAVLCNAGEDFVNVTTPRAAFEAYTTLVRAMIPGSAKARFERNGVRGYWVSATSGMGGAMTMLAPGWTVVTAACLDMATMKIEQDCSIDALEVVLRNFRLAGADGALKPVRKKTKR